MRIPLIAAILALASSPAYASFVDLTQVSFAASNTLVIQGVTVTGQNGGLVSAVAGKGLGVGVDGSIDRVDILKKGIFSGGSTDPLMSLSVNGFVNSISFSSYLIVGGPAPSAGFSAFPLSGRAFAPSVPSLPFTLTFPTPTTSRTLDFGTYRPSSITDIGLYTDRTVDDWYRGYLTDNGFPDVTFSFGVSITGIDFTPTTTPEPSTLLISSLGFAAAFWRRRRDSVSHLT